MNWLAAILWSILFASALHAMVAARFASRWKNEPLPDAESPPLTLLRPIKAGVPQLREKLTQLARAMRTDDRLVLGVNAGSADAAIADLVREDFAEKEILIVHCDEGEALNPKISKLLQMEAAAGGEHLVLSDSEAEIDGAWLNAFRREWAGSGADVLTCGYRFAGGDKWAQSLDAAPTLFSLWPGLMFVRRFGRLNFTLGACTALRRSDLASVGGWAAFADNLAEDNRLGVALAQAGKSIRLSRQIATLDSDPMTWRDYWRHQRRVAVTYRICNPAGFAGMLFTHSVWAGTLLLVLPSESRWSVAAGVAVVQFSRWLCFRSLAKTIAFPRERLMSTLLISDVVEALCWLLAWFSPTVWWAGKSWCISHEGSLRES